MDKIKLKPCPFCGGDAEMQQGKYQGLRTFEFLRSGACLYFAEHRKR